MPPAEPLLPDYGGGCLSNLVPALFAAGRPAAWLPAPVRPAQQVVLLVVDGLGWHQLRERLDLAPCLAAMSGGVITSVAPTTTASALTSIALGAPPAVHGVVGYRVRVLGDRVLNVLRWRTSDGDARADVPPDRFQPVAAFAGRNPPVVTRSEFASTGFTSAHLGGTRLHGWRQCSSIAVEVGALLAAGEPFVYAYYDGVDKVAHEYGFGTHYDAEVVAADRLVSDVAAVLPAGAALVVTADHGQVEVGDRLLPLGDDVLSRTALVTGEGRFLWLHVRPGERDAVLERCRGRFEEPGLAWVRTRRQVAEEGWFGGPLAPEFSARLGDVAIVAREPVAFADPGDSGSASLRCRHGSMTPDEVEVPLLAVGSSAS